MPAITKTEMKINVCENGALGFKQEGGLIIVSMGTDEFGPVQRVLTAHERFDLLQVLDAKRELAAGWDAIEEVKRVRSTNAALCQEIGRMRRALRLFRDFTNHATQWMAGCRVHPIWLHVAEMLGPDNSTRPSQKEWAFLWPENTEPLGED